MEFKNRRMPVLRAFAAGFSVSAMLVLTAGMAISQASGPVEKIQRSRQKTRTPDETVSAVLLSDVHFEPFFDPGKAAQLAAAPASEWKQILDAPASADRESRFAALEKTCKTRGEDTSYPLFESSLQAVRREGSGAKFATVSGDLLSHAFTCKYGALFPKAAPKDYRAFVEKTLAFVIDQLNAALAGAPVYVALGNNDSDCGDYQLDPQSDFLKDVGAEATKGFPGSERSNAAETFAAGGYFNVRLPDPIQNARLIVLDDIFMAARYETCGGKADTSPSEVQLAWLQSQLTEARAKKEKVWVMAHIPPGVDVHASALRLDEICGEKGPKMFLSSEKIVNELTGFGDVVQLAIFAHTHMDEVRVLKPEQGAPGAAADAAMNKNVAVKMVSSISPIDGNTPSFTIARVEPATAQLKDYRVFTASNTTGVGTAWREEYDWGKTYHETDFDASAVSKEVAEFSADPDANTARSRDYISNFSSGAPSPLALVWPQYVCGLSNDSAQQFKTCMCAAGK